MSDNLLNHPNNELIRFQKKGHKYFHKDLGRFEGFTSLLKKYKKPFNAKATAERCNKNPYSEWYDLGVKNILQAWKEKGNYSIILGNQVHDAIELMVNEQKLDDQMPYVVDMFYETMEEWEIEPIRSEFIIFNEKLKRASAIDVVGKKDGMYVVIDTKSFENGLETKSYNKFLSPIDHLDESKFMSVSLQTSAYMDWLERFYDVPVYPIPFCYWNNSEEHDMYPLFDLRDEIRTLEEFEL